LSSLGQVASQWVACMQFSSSLCKPENVVRFLQKRFFGKLFHMGVCFGESVARADYHDLKP